MAIQRPRRQLQPAASASRSSRHARPPVSYRDPSSDEDDEEEEFEAEDEYEASSGGRKRGSPSSYMTSAKRRRPSAVLSDSGESILYEQTPRRRNPPVKPRPKPTKKVAPQPNPMADVDPYSAGVVPPWQSLPYQILLEIFQYASFPLVDERTFHQTANWTWLLSASKLCRAFSEPALTVLYRSPCLTPMDRAHTLCGLLKADQSHMLYNYRSKVEKLQIEVEQTAAYTLTGSGLLDLHGLVFHTPRLMDLEIHHQKDFSPYRKLEETVKWRYPPELFGALAKNVDGVSTRLRSWRWSSRMVNKHSTPEGDLLRMVELHHTPSFQELRKIAFVNYQAPLPPKKITAEFVMPEHEKMLAEAITLLPNLEYIIFEASTLLNRELLRLLPANLKHLDIIACDELVSDDMAEFLLTHGSQLRTLTLNHNQSLRLSFFTVLGTACPHLTSLKMNLTYYNLHSTVKDSEPFFDHLLLENEVPSWPATLQMLELIQLRKWDVEAAEVFFRSLLDSAGALPDLRILVIKAILDTISWRDRGGFREKWQKAFERVFKRKSSPPNPHLRSIGAYAEYKNPTRKQPDSKPQEVEESHVEERDEDDVVLPRAARKPQPSKTASIEEPTTRALRSSNAPPKSRRLLKRLSYKEESSSESESPPPTSEETAPRSRKTRAEHEVAALKRSAGVHRPRSSSPPRLPSPPSDAHAASGSGEDSDDRPLLGRRRNDVKANQEVVQGMCEIVDFKIDNLRPTEMQFKEVDFLDSEPEGDEDWDGTNEEAGENGYAW